MADTRHRFWTVYSYVIAYRRETTPPHILTIVHGTHQLEAFFQQRIRKEQTGPRERAAETGEY